MCVCVGGGGGGGGGGEGGIVVLVLDISWSLSKLTYLESIEIFIKQMSVTHEMCMKLSCSDLLMIKIVHVSSCR